MIASIALPPPTLPRPPSAGGSAAPHLCIFDPRAVRTRCKFPCSMNLARRTRPTPYGRSKLAAEQAIRASNVPFTILRPVLISAALRQRLCSRDWRGGRAVRGRCRSDRFEPGARSWGAQNLVEAIRFPLRTALHDGRDVRGSNPEPLTLAQIIAALRGGDPPPRALRVPARASPPLRSRP